MMYKTKYDQLEGCFLGGVIGDAMGSAYENQLEQNTDTFYPFGKPEIIEAVWQITDDSQLTFATIHAIIEDTNLSPEVLAKHFLVLYKKRSIRGLGASTLKSLRELEVGGHWSQVGRMGEYAAGNGAAMRIAPIAFLDDMDRTRIRDITSITHKNDEAYVGALSVIIGLREIINNNWDGKTNLLPIISSQLPDSRVRDRLIEIESIVDIDEVGSLGNSGYVVDSVPLALAAANQIANSGLDNMFKSLIKIGGDTDTNCSIAGQIAGCLIGRSNFSFDLTEKLKSLPEYNDLIITLENFGSKINWLK